MIDLPLPLSAILEVAFARGYLQHVSLAASSSGKVQGSARQAASNGHAVELHDNPVMALLRAMHPGYGHSWAEALGDDLGEIMDDWWASLDEDEDLI